MTTFSGPSPDEVEGIGSLTLGGFLDEVAARFAGDEAVVFDDPLRGDATLRWTYADLRAETRQIAKALIAAGVERGEGVGIVMGNQPEALAGIFAAAMTGAIAVPISTFAPAPELAGMLEKADVSAVLTQARLLSRRFGDDIRALKPGLPSLREVAVVGEESWDSFMEGAGGVSEERSEEHTSELPSLMRISYAVF